MIIIDPIIIILPLLVFLLTKKIFISIIVLIFVLHFMYSPEKTHLSFSKDIFYSPSSGYINNIKEDDENITLSLFLNIFDNHTQYAPIKSVLIKQEKKHGLFVPAYKEHAINNEKVILTLYNPDYDFYYKISQITGILTRRIITFKKSILLPGERLGFIVLGSRVDVSIPKKNVSQIYINKNEHIKELTPLFKIKN